MCHNIQGGVPWCERFLATVHSLLKKKLVKKRRLCDASLRMRAWSSCSPKIAHFTGRPDCEFFKIPPKY